ncbi:MAG: alpha/beta hydrolase-fold protein, partial [Candidatus Sericytochromatia bacterium]|nr:alpha/beta hydrolase-fold protein [Candidatus Sericytochromatia bacterium]
PSPSLAPRVVLSGTVEVPAEDSAAYRLAAADTEAPVRLRPAGNVRVFLADGAGAALPGIAEERTDAQGRYTFQKVPPGYSYMVVAETPQASGKTAQFRTLVKVTDLGASAAIDPATTMVTSAVLEGLPGGDMGELNPARFQTLRTRVAGALRAGKLPDFSNPVQVRESLRQLVQQNQEILSTLSQMQQELRAVTQKMDALQAELAREASATPTTAIATPTGAIATPTSAPASPATPNATAAPKGSDTPAISSPLPSPSKNPGQSPVVVPKADDFLWERPPVTAAGVTYRTFNSATVGGKVSYHIYTPPTYQTETTRRFPVLYWLHGTGGGDAGLAPFTKIVDDAIKARKIPPMLVVYPNGLPRSQWVNSFDGARKVETMVIQDLIPEIDRQFRTKAERAGRVIEGFSMGGYGAGRLGFKYQQLFAGISMFAGGPLDLEFEGARADTDPEARAFLMTYVFGSMDYYVAVSPWRLAEANAASLKTFGPIRVVVGDADQSYQKNVAFHDLLTSLGIPHEYRMVPQASHEIPKLVAGLGDNHWAFYRKLFGAP